MTLRYRVRATGAIRWMRIKAQPVRDATGRVTRAINVVEDITDLKQVESTLRLLADASRSLAGSLDYEETLRRVASLAVPDLADWCMVDVFGERGLERMAVAHADPALAGVAARAGGPDRRPGRHRGPGGGRRAPATASSTRTSTRRTSAAPRVDPRHHELRHAARRAQLGERPAHGPRPAARGDDARRPPTSGRVLGAEQLGGPRGARPARGRRDRQRAAVPPALGDRAHAAELAAPARAAGDRRARGRARSTGRPATAPTWAATSTTSSPSPRTSGSRSIGDVCGKGAEAAAVTALARYTIRTAAVRRRSPAAILRWLNDAMLRQDRDGRFCTIACVHIDTSRPRIRLAVACGGHPPGAAAARGRRRVDDLGAAGTLLGLVPDPELEDAHGEMGPGDALLLYTDGVTEARAPQRMLEPGGAARRARRAAGRLRADAGRRAGRRRARRRSRRRRATTSPCSRCSRAADAHPLHFQDTGDRGACFKPRGVPHNRPPNEDGSREMQLISTDADVIVVGAGPTGLMLAGELGRAGVRTLVLERPRRSETSRRPAV